MSKSRIIANLIFSAISMTEIYALFGKKYLTLSSLLVTAISYEVGNQIHISMQENNAGGTTPYNPLKIPAKNFTYIPAKKTGNTPYNPLKIPAKNITPAH